MTIDPTQWVKVATAAHLLGVARQTIYHHIRAGHIETLNLDGRLYVRRNDLGRINDRPQSKAHMRRTTKQILPTTQPMTINGLHRT